MRAGADHKTRPETDLIDRRQRLAATLLFSAFDLPAPADIAARQLVAAARLCPGVTMDEIPSLGPGSRRNCLVAARDLIDEIVDDLDSDQTRADFIHT